MEKMKGKDNFWVFGKPWQEKIRLLEKVNRVIVFVSVTCWNIMTNEKMHDNGEMHVEK